MNTIFHLKKALFYSTILLSLIILLEGCKKKSTVEDFGTRIDQCYEDRIDTTLMADGTMFIETTGTAPLNSAVDESYWHKEHVVPNVQSSTSSDIYMMTMSG